jgi:hypothetical protein
MKEFIYCSIFAFCTHYTALLCNVNSYVFYHLFFFTSFPFFFVMAELETAIIYQSLVAHLDSSATWKAKASFIRKISVYQGSVEVSMPHGRAYREGGFYMSTFTLFEVLTLPLQICGIRKITHVILFCQQYAAGSKETDGLT